MKFSTHRVLQLSVMADRASGERVRFYCNAIKASEINNSAAAIYFNDCARQWDSIRVRATNLLLAQA